MNARWVLDTFWPELPQLDYTVVARWWPWEYYSVSTTRVWQDTSDPMYRDIKVNSAASMQYVTRVYKCDKHGTSNEDHFYYMKEYPDSVLARSGHKEVVELLEKGKLSIKDKVS